MSASASQAGAGGYWAASGPIRDENGEGRYWRTVLKGFLIFALAISIAGLVIYRSARNSVTVAVTNNLQVIATLKATQIDHWLAEKEYAIRGDMRSEFARPELAGAVGQWLRGGMRDAVLRASLLKSLQQISAAHQYLEISLRSAQDGSLLLTSDDEADTAAIRALALASLKSEKTVLEDFHIDDTGGVPKMHIGFINAVPISSGLPTVVVVDVTLDASEILSPVIQQWPGWNISANTQLLREEGREVIALNSLHKFAANALPFHFSTAQAGSMHAEAIHAASGALRGNGFLNQPVFAYAIPVPHTPWTLIAEVGEKDAFAKLNTIAAMTAAIVALLLLASGWWLLEQHRRATARLHHDAETRLLTSRINYLARYANDCIILCDISGQIMEVNDRCCRTYGYAQEELLRMKLGDLHAPETRAELPQRLQQITAELGLIYESEHQRKNGTSFSVEMSAGLIDVDGKACYQAIIRDISARKKLEMEREENMQRLHNLTCRLVNLQEEERRHLSGELHDQIGANLATMTLNLRSIGNLLPAGDQQRVDEMLTETAVLLSGTIASIRDYCADLRPAILDYSGLVPALKELVQRFGRRSGIAARFRQESMHGRLPAQTESMLFRIAQEALTNCAKHSRAKSVEVLISKQDHTVVMTVSDDGDGFDPRLLGSRQVGLGLLTMRERAAMAGGELSVLASPGSGTTIRVVVDSREVQQRAIQDKGEGVWLGPDQSHSPALRRLA